MKILFIVVCIMNLYLNGYAQCGPNEPYYLSHSDDTTFLVSNRNCGNVLDNQEILLNQNKLAPNFYYHTLYMSGNIIYNCCNSKKIIHLINQDSLILIYGIQSDTGVICECDSYNLITLFITSNSKKVHIIYYTMTQITLDTVVFDNYNSIKINKIQPVHVFPIPANDYITIEFSNQVYKSYDLKIIDILGKCVYKINSVSSNKQIIDLSHFKSGIYFYEIRLNTEEIIRGKITKK